MTHLPLLLLTPSESLRGTINTSTLLYFFITWTIFRLVDLGGLWFSEIPIKKERDAALILLKPSKTLLKFIVIVIGLLLWLDNIGVHVSTLLKSHCIGGFAIALACQDMLKTHRLSTPFLPDQKMNII